MKNLLSVLRFIWCHPANREHKIYALYRGVMWQVRKRLFNKYVDIGVFDGLVLRCYPDSPSASLVIYCEQSPDYHEMNFMRRYLRPGDTFLDVGANIGVYSLLAASRVGAEGRVIAFEPGPQALHRLVENIQLNSLGNVEVHGCALGDQEGAVDFLSQCDTTNRMRTCADVDKSVVSVPLRRLDDVVHVYCALGKMDIEGAEPLALRGAGRLLNDACPPVWLLEVNGSLHAYGFTEEGFVSWLSARGYDIALYDADRNELAFNVSQPWTLSPNVFAIARDRRYEVAERCGARLIEV